MLDRFTQGLPRAEVGTSTCAAFPAPPLSGEIHVIDDPGAEQSTIHIGAVGVPAGHADGPALDVLSSALGASLSSRLSLKIREEHGYTYGVHMLSREWRAHGLLEVTTSVETDKTADALRGILAELDRTAVDPLDDDELFRAKVRALPDDGANHSAVTSLHDMAAYGQPADAALRRSRALLALTASDLTRVAALYLSEKRRVVTIVGDASRITHALEGLGIGPVVSNKR
jgi:zinc protease